MSSIPDDFFEQAENFEPPVAEINLFDAIRFVSDRLHRFRQLQISGTIPASLFALSRLPKVFEFIEHGDFWQLSDQSLDASVEQAEREGATAAGHMATYLADRGLPPAEFEKKVERARKSVVNARVEANYQLVTPRTTTLQTLRKLGHSALADEAEDLWKHDHGNDVRLRALKAQLFSDDFNATTVAFIRERRHDFVSLNETIDRSGPATAEDRTPSALRTGRMSRVKSIDSVMLTVSGATEEIEVPFKRTYLEQWRVSHPCRCPDANISFSENPPENWRVTGRLFERHRTIELLRGFDSLLQSTKLFKPHKVPYTFLTNRDFRNWEAPIWEIPQVTVNYYFCTTCGAEFLARISHAPPQEPSREFHQGLDGVLHVIELIEIQGPSDRSFLEFIDANRVTP